jgi:hypothetical protein
MGPTARAPSFDTHNSDLATTTAKGNKTRMTPSLRATTIYALDEIVGVQPRG